MTASLPFRLLGLTGYAGAGKDTVADLLVEHAGFHKLAFADALRSEVADAFGLPVDLFTDRITKEQPNAALALTEAPTALVKALVATGALNPLAPEWLDALEAPRSPRQILQWWGTEYRRAVVPEYWAIKAQSAIEELRNSGAHAVVLTDCRYGTEASLIRNLGGLIWQIKRPGHDGAAEGNHSSSNDGSSFSPDYVIHNDGDGALLKARVWLTWVRMPAGGGVRHSPGPWLWVNHALHCGPEGYESSPAENEANERLIAAAPDLLDAARLALDWMVSTGADGSPLATLHAAVTKATGVAA